VVLDHPCPRRGKRRPFPSSLAHVRRRLEHDSRRMVATRARHGGGMGGPAWAAQWAVGKRRPCRMGDACPPPVKPVSPAFKSSAAAPTDPTIWSGSIVASAPRITRSASRPRRRFAALVNGEQILGIGPRKGSRAALGFHLADRRGTSYDVWWSKPPPVRGSSFGRCKSERSEQTRVAWYPKSTVRVEVV